MLSWRYGQRRESELNWTSDKAQTLLDNAVKVVDHVLVCKRDEYTSARSTMGIIAVRRRDYASNKKAE